MKMDAITGAQAKHGQTKTAKWVTHFSKNMYLYALLLPGTIYLLIFDYIPLVGLVLAFKDFSPGDSFFGGEWVGLKWFNEFFNSIYFFRLLRNTILLHLYDLLWGFPIPIMFALLLHELRRQYFKRVVQTISYFPHFISTVIIAGLIVNFLSPTDGIITRLIHALTGSETNLLGDQGWFRTIYVISNVWASFGWNSIIYLAALTAVDVHLYEAADMEGAGRWKKMTSITLPSIMPTIVTLLILNMGKLLSVGYEKIILLYNPGTYETADVISTYVYRRGLLGADYSFGVAVGLFNSVASFLILILINYISKRVNNVSLW